MNREYVNARDVLPPALLAEVQKHVTGLVWIPAPRIFYHQRRALIRTLLDQGVPTKDIARLAGISVRRVNQIAAGKNGHENRQSRRGSGK